MKKIVVLLSFIFVLSGCGNTSIEHSLKTDLPDTEGNKESIRLGYCPTMENDAQSLQEENNNLELIEFGSAAETLDNLKNGQVDLILIGRKAKAAEITANVSENKLEKQTYTLIAPQKQIISESELPDLQISSCLPSEIKHLFPELNLTFKDCDYKNGSVWLIDWDYVTDDLDLLIPIDEQGQKIRKYRSAFLYMNENNNNLTFYYGISH